MKTTAQKRKEAREARAADPYAYQRSPKAKKSKDRLISVTVDHHDRKFRDIDILRDTANGAVAGMRLYLATHPQQVPIDRRLINHDRDIILLDIHAMLRELTDE